MFRTDELIALVAALIYQQEGGHESVAIDRAVDRAAGIVQRAQALVPRSIVK